MKAHWLLSLLLPLIANADIQVDNTDAAFAANVNQYLNELEKSSEPALNKLVVLTRGAPRTIAIRPITNDRATWHRDGDRERSHTDPVDGKHGARPDPVAVFIYLNPKRVMPGKARGVLTHELVHALDYTHAWHAADYKIAERRAVFLENVWRESHGKKLKTKYHGRFDTLDYQRAKAANQLPSALEYLLSHADLPPSP